MKKGVYFSYTQAGYATVSLTEAAAAYADSIRYGATGEGGALSGGLAQYGLYQTSSGCIAVAALETVFVERLKKILNLAEI
jgi:hypothetical protein